MRKWLVSPRAPASKAYLVTLLGYCVFLIAVSTWPAETLYLAVTLHVPQEWVGTALIVVTRDVSLLAVFGAMWLLTYTRWKFSGHDSLELALGVLLAATSSFSGLLSLPLIGLGLLVFFYPYSGGPEPDGWASWIAEADRLRKEKEEKRLKSRRE